MEIRGDGRSPASRSETVLSLENSCWRSWGCRRFCSQRLTIRSLWENPPRYVYGAVTIGSFWVFGRLDVQAKLVTQDIGGYKVPDDVEDLVRVLVGILEG